MRGLALVVLLGVCGRSAAAQAVEVQFQGVEMPAFLAWASEVSKKRIIFPSDSRTQLASQKVYLLSPKPIPVVKVLAVTRAVLLMYGWSLVRVGTDDDELYRVVKTTEALSQATPLVDKISGENGERYRTHLLVLKHVTAKAAVGYLTKAKLVNPQRASAVEVPEANAILLTDLEPQLAKVSELLKRIDRPGPLRSVRFFALEHEKAADLAALLQRMQTASARGGAGAGGGRSGAGALGGGPDGVPPSIEAHERTNTLIARGTAEQLTQLEAMIRQLDRPAPQQRLRVEYVRLRHAKAKDVEALLGKVVSKPPFVAERGRTAPPTPRAGAAAGGVAGGTISIVADERANALVLTATAEQHRLLAQLIARVDRPRAQVLLEVAIVEFTPSDAISLGIELLDLEQPAAGQRKGLINTAFGLSSLVDEAGSVIAPGSAGQTVGRRPIPGIGLNAFAIRGVGDRLPLVLRALQTRTKTNVLSLPRVLALDGVPAELRVADETPVLQTNALNTATSTTSFQQFVPAETTIKFTAVIAGDKSIQLDIEQVLVEQFVGTSPSAGLPPAKTSRSLVSKVRIPDRKIAVLGGFAVARETLTEDKVPLLGDIPLIGYFFRSSIRSVSKTHLYIFVQPRVLDDEALRQLLLESERLRKERDKVVPPLYPHPNPKDDAGAPVGEPKR